MDEDGLCEPGPDDIGYGWRREQLLELADEQEGRTAMSGGYEYRGTGQSCPLSRWKAR